MVISLLDSGYRKYRWNKASKIKMFLAHEDGLFNTYLIFWNGVYVSYSGSAWWFLSLRTVGIMALNRCLRFVLSQPYKMGLVIVLNMAKLCTAKYSRFSVCGSIPNSMSLMYPMSATVSRIIITMQLHVSCSLKYVQNTVSFSGK